MENLGFVDDYPTLEKDKEYHYYKKTDKTYTFEEAVSLTGNGKFHKFILIISGLALMAMIVETMSVSLSIMVIKCDLGFTIYEQGFLASAGFLGIVLSAHTWGFLSDTWGRLKVIRMSVTTSLIFSLISVFSVNVWMHIVLRFLVGLMYSGCQTSVFSYVGEFHGSKTRTQAVTFVSVFLPFGMIFLPALGIGILPLEFDAYIYGTRFSSWRVFGILCIIPSLIATAALPFLPESPKYLFIQGQHEEALEVLSKIYSINHNTSKDEYPVRKLAEGQMGANIKNITGVVDGLRMVWRQTVPIFQQGRFWTSLNLLLHIFIIFFVAHGLFMWFPGMLSSLVTYIDSDMTVCEIVNKVNRESMNATVSTEGLSCSSYVNILMFQVLIIMGFLFVGIFLTIGFLIRKVGKKRLLIIWLIFSGIAGLAIYFTRGFYLNMFILICFMAIGNCGGIVTTISVDYYPTNINGMAMCLIMMIGRLGVVVGSNIMGIVLQYDCNLLFFISAGIIFCITMLSFLIPNTDSKPKPITVTA